MPNDRRSARARWLGTSRHAAALLVFVLAAAAVYGPVWLAGGSEVAPVRPALERGMAQVTRADVIFEAWLVSRHARTLLMAPHRLFDTEHCAPAEKTLALGIPMVTLGALAIPAFLLSGDPVLSYNATLVLLSLVGAVAMYTLVLAWTGAPGAGIAAGLLYSFHPIRLTDITHPTVWDGTWTVFALLFAERLFARGRWRDAAGLAAMTILQIAASFYPLVAAALLTTPFLLWLLVRNGLRHVSVGQLAFVLGSIAIAAAWLLGPYLLAETALGGGELHRERFTYATLGRLAPGAWLFPGWSMLGLVGFALAARRAWILPRIQGDPRWVLLAGAALAALVAIGHNAYPLPNAHRLLALVLPGLDAVRVVLRVFSATHLAFALLAGIGAAALIRLGGRAGVAIATVLVLVCAFEMLRAPSLGIDRTYRWALEEIRPDPAEIAFFDKLAELGDDGPLLEVPVDQTQGALWMGAPRIMLSLYHRRRTSACFGSYPPPGREALAALASRLPEPEAIDSLSQMGFTTVIFRHRNERSASFRRAGRVRRAAERGRGIEHIYSTPTHTAFSLRPGTRR
jgi:hypothetical protein